MVIMKTFINREYEAGAECTVTQVPRGGWEGEGEEENITTGEEIRSAHV